MEFQLFPSQTYTDRLFCCHNKASSPWWFTCFRSNSSAPGSFGTTINQTLALVSDDKHGCLALSLASRLKQKNRRNHFFGLFFRGV